ncbi:hypothetical protein [Paenibacillus sp. DYY-L-2]|uniref:hypothetical protein n=1 Tax=Paenibacillus sp. DYY-L-2 TaxID=3447013 RepID=UPI003F4FFDA2
MRYLISSTGIRFLEIKASLEKIQRTGRKYGIEVTPIGEIPIKKMIFGPDDPESAAFIGLFPMKQPVGRYLNLIRWKISNESLIIAQKERALSVRIHPDMREALFSLLVFVGFDRIEGV